MLDTWFRSDLMGVPGDEDGGGLTAFVLYSMMGFYPVTPGEPVYSIGSPVFPELTIHLTNGKAFKVVAEDVSKVNKYIQSATLNGKPLDAPVLHHDDLMAGGKLVLKMGDRPNKDWGSK
jgi:putative alpha-1,2-mannosidase